MLHSGVGVKVKPIRLHPVFDRAVLLSQTMNDASLAAEVLGLFLQELDHIEKVDWKAKEIGFEMHKLKGAAAAIGAVQLEILAARWTELGAALEPELKAAAKAFRSAAA